MMTIGIFGSYMYGNYGDDLMALAFAKFLVSKNHNVIVFRLRESLARKYGVSTTESIEYLVKSSDKIIIGGGAFLTYARNAPLNFVEKDRENYFFELLKYCEEFDRKVTCVSIGGDGFIDKNRTFEEQKLRFLNSDCFTGGTVRLETDVQLLSNFKKEAHWVPDVLWNTKLIFNFSQHEQERSNKYRIGINIHKRKAKFAWVIKFLTKLNSRVEISFIGLHDKSADLQYEYQTPIETNRVKNINYDEPEIFLSKISNLDLIISEKLHLGITGLTYGVPFISVFGKNKTVSQLKSVKAYRAIWKSKSYVLLNTMKFILFNSVAKKASYFYDWELIERLRKSSNAHFTYLNELINEDTSN